MMNPFLIGDKLYLRSLSMDDLNGNYQFWMNDPFLNQENSHHVFPYSREDLADYIQHAYNSKTQLPLAIIDKVKDIHIGNIALSNIDYINSRASFGIIIGEKEYWRGGFAREATFLTIKHAFESLNMNRVYSGTTSANIAGQKLMEAMGMVREGVKRCHLYKNGQYVDIIEYGILKNEFLTKFNLNK